MLCLIIFSSLHIHVWKQYTFPTPKPQGAQTTQNLPPPTNIKPHRFPFLLSFQGRRRGFLHTLWAYSILTTSQFEIKYLRGEGGYSLSNQRKIFFLHFLCSFFTISLSFSFFSSFSLPLLSILPLSLSFLSFPSLSLYLFFLISLFRL